MTFFVLFVLVLFFFVTARRSGRARAGMIASGLEARGLILRASPTSTRTMINGQPFEQRSVVLDVEVMGRAPYEVSLMAAFPRLCEAFPGAALDLRVDPRNPNNVTVVGPVGASGWMGATAGLFPWAPSAPNVASGVGTVVMIVVLAFLGLGAVGSLVSFVSTRGGESGKPTAEPPPLPRAPPPPPHVAPTVQAPVTESAACAEATRCCKTVGRTECTRYARMSEAVCKTALQEEKRAAVKLHKTCE